MHPFSLLVKPVGGRCNASCRYCFYRRGGGVIARETLERALSEYAALPFASKSVTLQGGEPLLSPRYVLDAVEASGLERGIQTNATLVTPELAERLAAGGWLVGVSLDGPRELHEAGRGATFDAAVRGIRLLEAAGADYNILTVVSRANVSRPVEVYRFLRDNFSTRFHQYIECTGPDGAFAISGDEWGAFLVSLFDEWAAHDVQTVSVRLFDSLANAILRGVPLQCSFARHCRHHLVLEHDGSVYPCDFHVRDELRLGSIMRETWRELLESPKCLRFAAAKTASLPARCRECDFLDFCNGDCPRNRFALCDGWRRFFGHSLERLAVIAAERTLE